jgi:hypothetical protein
MSKTKGQQRVKADFNPAKNDVVDRIKNKSAELIDLLEELRPEFDVTKNEDGTFTLKGDSEKERLIEISQTYYETAAMYAVKSCFTND